jgi:hypothetical protein
MRVLHLNIGVFLVNYYLSYYRRDCNYQANKKAIFVEYSDIGVKKFQGNGAMGWCHLFFIGKSGSYSQNSEDKSEIIHVFPANN